MGNRGATIVQDLDVVAARGLIVRYIELDALQIEVSAADGNELGCDEVEARNERHLLVADDVGRDDVRRPRRAELAFRLTSVRKNAIFPYQRNRL